MPVRRRRERKEHSTNTTEYIKSWIASRKQRWIAYDKGQTAMSQATHVRRESLGPLHDPRYASKAIPRSSHTAEEIARIERDYGMIYAGSCQDEAAVLVPVFYR